MASDDVTVRIDSMMGRLTAEPLTKQEPDASAPTWDLWSDLVELDSAIAGTLFSMRDAGVRGTAPKSSIARWRIVLTDETRWAGQWSVRRELLAAACDLLDEAYSTR